MTFWYIVKRLTRKIGEFHSWIISLKPDISIGKGTIVEPHVVIRTQAGGSISIGKNCWISQGVQIITWGGDIVIGDNTTLNPYTVVYGQGGTRIGNGVRIAAHCVIVPSNHKFDNVDEFIYKQGLSKEGIVIEDNVWLGAGVKVMDGVTISYGTVVGANAVVTKSTDKNSVYVGVPARKIKDR